MGASGPEQFFKSKSGNDVRITDEELVIEGLRTRRFRWADAQGARLVQRKELDRGAGWLDALTPETRGKEMFTASTQRTLHIEFSTGKAKIDVSKEYPDFKRPKQVEAIVRAHLEPYVTLERVLPRSRKSAYAGAFVRYWAIALLMLLALWVADRLLHLGIF